MDAAFGDQYGVNFIQLQDIAKDAIRKLGIDPDTGAAIGN